MFERSLMLPDSGRASFFLWGDRDHLRGLRTLAEEHPGVRRRIVVCLEPRARRTDDGIDILPAAEFVHRLGQGTLTQQAGLGHRGP